MKQAGKELLCLATAIWQQQHSARNTADRTQELSSVFPSTISPQQLSSQLHSELSYPPFPILGCMIVSLATTLQE